MARAFETYGLAGIADELAAWGQPRFRAKQLVQWAYGKGAQGYDEMTNLPKGLRERLKNDMPMHVPHMVSRDVSGDGTRKYLLQLADGSCVETVGIPSLDTDAKGNPRRLTVCFSTQVGCPMACAFCATGQEGFTRNLFPGEIAQQLLAVERDIGMRATNAVGMGQGEPFLNFENVANALRILNSPDGLGIGARHITVSTCGNLEGIERFAELGEQFVLAVSLHAARQGIRNEIMPRCASVPLSTLHDAIAAYNARANRRTSLEYLLLQGINDAPEDLQALLGFCSGLRVHVNLLPMNDVPGSPYRSSGPAALRQWEQELLQAGIPASVRTSRGADIAAACGQLKHSRGQDMRP